MLLIILSMLIAFLATYMLTPKFIIFLERIGMVGYDIHKKGKDKVAEMGGPAILAGFLAGVFFYVWVKVFLYGEISGLVQLFASISTIIIITMIGVFDDLSRLLKKADRHFKRIGLKQWHKPLLTLPAAIPLMAIMAGGTTMSFPFIGEVHFGILYPLLLVPLGVAGASNGINMLAGMNGLEASMSSVLLAGLGTYAYLHTQPFAAIIAFAMCASLLAFLKYNQYPAKIFPGDSFVYAVGAAVASIAIIGNMEKFAVIAFLPWVIEFFLKLRSGFTAECFGALQKDGALKAPNGKIYSLTHLAMRLGRFNEKQIVWLFVGFELMVLFAATIVSSI